MKRYSVLFSQLLSVVFHPFFIPTYLFVLCRVLFFNGLGRIMYLYDSFWVSLFFICLFTAVIPLLSVLILYKTGQVTSIALKNAKERRYPYLITLISYATLAFLLYKAGNPFCFYVYFAIVCLALVATINLVWKISAHMTAFGGLMAIVMFQSYVMGLNPYILFAVLFTLAGLIASARIRLESHDLSQILVGFLLGFSLLLFL